MVEQRIGLPAHELHRWPSDVPCRRSDADRAAPDGEVVLPMMGVPRHVACVMDGNGRWAAQRSLPRTAGHLAAEAAVIDVIEAAHLAGVQWLSLYAFSTENWSRPDTEVDFLMRLVRGTVRKHALALHARGIRCRFLG